MPVLLHGEDTQSSYIELQNTLQKYKDVPKLRLSTENAQQAFQALFAIDMLEPKKVIVAEDLISQKYIKPKDLANLPESNVVILWEKKELPSSTLKQLPEGTIVKIFKPNPILFKFLDSIGTKIALQQSFLRKLPDSKTSLTWQIENRLLLLILIKLGYSAKKITEITKKPLYDWQIEKLQTQAKNLNLSTLKRLFLSTLKIETMLKSGFTNQDEKSLISLMLFRHFSN